MRVSVMFHLPALVLTQQIERVFRSLQKMNLAVRGLYGEGSRAMGDFYQISNQITLGRSELDLIQQVADVVPQIIDYERRARTFLINENQQICTTGSAAPTAFSAPLRQSVAKRRWIYSPAFGWASTWV